MLTLSLAACGTKNNGRAATSPAAPASALDLLEKVWNSYTDEAKFPASGGDYSEANSKEAPPCMTLSDRAAVDSALGLPETAKGGSGRVAGPHDEPEHLYRRCYHCTDDADALATALRDNIQQRRWMCGFPRKDWP